MLTLNDGRSELWQWDTGRTLDVDADCSQVHFSNKVFGRSIDVDVVDGLAIIPDVLLQTDKDLNVWAFVGAAENGYTKISKTFKVNRRNKPADYVFTPADQITLQTIQRQIGDLADLATEAKENLVAAINEAAASGGSGSMDLRVADGYVQYSSDGGITWTNLIAMADLKGEPGATGKSAYQYAVDGGYTGTEDEFSVKLAEEMSDGSIRVTNPNDSTHELDAGNQWSIFVRDSRLRSISITPVFSDGSSDKTFSWQLCETSDGSEVDYGSSALTIIKSGTASCGDTLTFDIFTSRNALCILTTAPVKMRYCSPSTAVNKNIRVGLRKNMAVMPTDYGCLSGTFILNIDDEPFMLKSAFTDKTISFYGDSLTQAVPSQYSKGYRNWIVELCGFGSQTNRGVSGYRLWQILDAISANTETADCISVMGGYNDGNQWDSARLGSLGDTTALESNEDATGTIYGTVYQICAVLKAKYPTTFLMFITPPAEKNPVSGKVSLAEIRKAILETAELFSIPVYDNYKLSGVNVTNMNIFTSDGAHWTDATHEMIGKNIAKWMLSTVGKTLEISGASAGTGTEVVARKERVSQFENDIGYATKTYVQNQIGLIPEKLPNPNALTFTGAVTGSYDGSAPLSVEIPSGGGASTDGGVGTGTYEFSVLASGTIPANTITAAEIGNGMIDTGITLGMLRQYKVFNMLYRCDSGNQYYSFSVGNPGQPLYTHKRFYYATSNAMNATILWLDSARTAVLMLGSTGNTLVTPPADVENMGSFLDGGLCSAGGAMSSINAYGNLADFTDESKIYVGVMNMSGQETNTKDFTWAICGVIK